MDLIGLVLGFAITAVVGYFGKHHYVIKKNNQKIDVTQTIIDTINTVVAWGTKSAEAEAKNHPDWTGDVKKQYVINLVDQALSNLPVPVKNPSQYNGLIGACIESALQGSKIAKADLTNTKPIEITEDGGSLNDDVKDQGLPEPAKIDGDIEAITNDSQSGQTTTAPTMAKVSPNENQTISGGVNA